MSDYDKKLADWKRKHGLDPMMEQNQDELRMAAEEQASRKNAWCFHCDKEMPVAQMRLITRRHDPYLQCDEGEGGYIAKCFRVRACPECFEEHYGAAGSQA